MTSPKGMPEVNIFSRLDKLVFIIFGLVILVAVSWKIIANQGKSVAKKSNVQKNDTSPLKQNKKSVQSEVSVVQKWDMPAELKEISALAYIDDSRFATVQDELGTIYIYNTADKKIERKIQFAQTGDYEGVAYTGSYFYVVRADGQLFETSATASDKNTTRQYKTSLTVKHNVEGLCYDKANNRLLLATKDDNPNHPGYKGIYAFDLEKKVFVEEPVFKIDLQHDLFSQSKKKNISPSSITIHPETQELFITDGPQSRLLISDKSGTPKQFLDLGKEFSQPEGITFDDKGNLYISNEGTKQPGNILHVKL